MYKEIFLLRQGNFLQDMAGIAFDFHMYAWRGTVKYHPGKLIMSQ
jgi:hypothetical protein